MKSEYNTNLACLTLTSQLGFEACRAITYVHPLPELNVYSISLTNRAVIRATLEQVLSGETAARILMLI